MTYEKEDCAIYRIGGNVYLVHCCWNSDEDDEDKEILYRYDPTTTEIKEVSRSEAMAVKIKLYGRNIMVEADGQVVDEADLIDMSGRKLAGSGRTGTGQLTLNAGSATNGVYSVALKKRGRIVGAKKILLK